MENIDMYQLNEKKAKIYSTGIHLPSEIIKSDDLFAEIGSDIKYGIPTNWMSEKMGIVERRMAPVNSKPSDLAIPAAKNAIDSAEPGIAEDIDLVIFCGIERDQPEPATAHIIQDKLGLNSRYAFDMANACFGFVDAMQVASSYIKCGIVKYALIITGEVPSKVMRAAMQSLKKGVDVKKARNMIGALSVGDAGGAVILGASQENEMSGFSLFNTLSHSSHSEECIYEVNEHGEPVGGQMLMGKITNTILKGHRDIIDETLNSLGWDSYDWMLSHQMGQKPYNSITNMSKVTPEKSIKTHHNLGNITSATFPVNYDKLLKNKKLTKGDRIGGCFAGSGVVIGQFGYIY